MDNCILQNNEMYLEKELLSKIDLIDYDIERTYYMVSKFMSKYKRLKCKNFKEPHIKITSTYKYIFVDEATKGINDYTKLDEFIDSKTEYQYMSSTITSLTNELFTDEEMLTLSQNAFNLICKINCYKSVLEKDKEMDMC